MLGSSELAALREEQERLMTTSVGVYRRSRTPNATGTWSEAFTLAATLSANVHAGGGWPSEPVKGARVTGRRTWVAVFPHGSDVRADDRLTCDGHTLEVVGLLSGGALATALRVLCVEAEA
jgi:head-tail adaptor